MNLQISIGSQSYTHQSIAHSLGDQGVEVLFGLMGDANLFLIDEFVRNVGGAFVPAAYDGSVVLMALAYAHVSNKIGVATVTHGPALTNCVTALTEGARGNIPMVLLAGDTPQADRRSLQDIDQRAVVAVTGAGWEQMRSAETATSDIAQAFYRARTERRPIVLNMSAEFMWQKVSHKKEVLKVFDSPAVVTKGPDFDAALGILASAKRPLILAGYGALGAKKELIELAERLDAPLATTLKGKDLFHGHPANIGIFGTLSSPAAYDVMGMADCIVAFGTSLHHFTTDRGRLTAGKRIVQVNDRAQQVALNTHPDAAVVADARQTAENFLYWVNEAEVSASGFATEFVNRDLIQQPVHTTKSQKPGTVHFAETLEKLKTILPDSSILVTDGGRFMTEVWCRVHVNDPRRFVLTAHFGSIGLGLQEAIGAAAAEPDKPVVLFTGDGGFMLGGINEFNTAVRLRQDLIVVVCNDTSYGAEYAQFENRAMNPELTLINWPSFAEMANALGGRGVRVSNPADLARATEAIKNRDGPLLIELMLDPATMPDMRI